MESILSAVGVVVSVMAFLVGFSSIRLRGERDRAVSRTDAAFAQLTAASRTGVTQSDADVAAANLGLREAETRDPIGRWTLIVVWGLEASLFVIGVTAGARSGLPFEANPFAWNSQSTAFVMLVAASTALLALGTLDYVWISRDIARRLEESPLSKATEAVRLLRAEDWRGAMGSADELVSRLPSWPWVRAFRAHVLGMMGQQKEAIVEIDLARQLDPTNVWWQIAHAEFLVSASRYEEAVALLDSASTSEVGRAPIASLKGAALYGMGRRGDAIHQFNMAIAIEPEQPEHRLRRGRAIVDASPSSHAGEPTAALLEVVLDEGERVALETVVRAGRQSLHAREIEQAVEDFSFALSRAEDANTLMLRAQAYLQSGQDSSAEQDFTRALEIGAARDEVHRRRAYALRSAGRMAAYESEISAAIELKATAFDYHMRAMQRLYAKDLEHALADFDSSLELDPENADVLAHRAQVLALMGKIEESEVEFMIASRYPNSVAHTYEVWLTTLMQTSREGEVEQLIDAALATEMNSTSRATVLSVSGSIFARLRLYSRALACFDEAENLTPASPDVAYRRSTCYMDMGRLEMATAAIDLPATEPSSLQPSALALRSWIRRTQGNFDDALTDISEAIRLRPEDADLLLARGCLLMSGEQLDLARSDLDAALRSDPRHKSALRHRFELHYRTGDLQGAFSDMQSLGDVGADESEMLELENIYWELAKDWNELIRVRRKLLDENPGDPDRTWELAAAYVNKNAASEAEELFDILRHKDGSLRARISHAVAVSMQGRSVEAVQLFSDIRVDFRDEADEWMESSIRQDLLPNYDAVMADWSAARGEG